MLRYLVTVLVVCLLLGNDPAPDWGETTDAARKLQGTWYGVSMENFYGEKSESEKLVLIFDNKSNFTLKSREFGGREIICLKGTFTTDTSKEPKTIDMIVTEASSERSKKTTLGVYQIKDGTLRWCYAQPDLQPGPKGTLPARPPEMTPKNIGERCYTFKRLPR
jgi:uncharacterized protein (TIGR03067 family)